MSRTSAVRKTLKRAMADRSLVRVRRHEAWDLLDGYVVGVGTKWVLLWMTDNANRPDGLTAVRRKDISGVRRVPGRERFAKRFLELEGHWPPTAPRPAVDLSRTRTVVSAFAERFPLIVISTEHDDHDTVSIGQPQEFAGPGFSLRSVGPNAEWDGPRRRNWSRWRFAELTRIEAGGAYESALVRVAGPPPPP